MKSNFRTGKLPENFLALGYISLLGGIISLFTYGYIGLIFIFVGLLIISVREGVIIDCQNGLYQTYNSILFIRFGKWKSIPDNAEIKVFRTQEAQVMSVESITRQDISEIHKLYLEFPDEDIELAKGKRSKMIEKGEKLASSLQINFTIID